MKPILPLRCFLLALALAGAPAFAAPGGDDFSRGVAASRAGAWTQARDHFLAAQRAGNDRPALHYNLAVVYYRLGDDERAKQAFERAARDPRMAPLAYYNLGLIAVRNDRVSEARSAFERARSLATDDGLRALAEERLMQLRDTATDRRWYSGATASIGYDDSVIDPVTQTAGGGSSFAELLASARGPLVGSYRNGLLGEVAGYATRYTDNDSYDTNLLRLGLAGAVTTGSWRTEARGQWEYSSLAGNDYLSATHLGVGAGHSKTNVALDYRVSIFRALDTAYQPLEGVRHQASVAKRLALGDANLRLRYLFEYNDREDLLDGSTFASYSPIRHDITGRWALPLGDKWDVSVDVGYRDSRYLDANRFADGSETEREDRRILAGLNLSRVLRPGWTLDLGISHVDNSSNIDFYDYDQNVYTLGIGAEF